MLKNKKGITLVEVMIVVLILGILASIAIPNVTKYIKVTERQMCLAGQDALQAKVSNYMNGEEIDFYTRVTLAAAEEKNNQQLYYITSSTTQECANWADVGSFNTRTMQFTGGKTGDCLYIYKVCKENEDCENEEDIIWLYGVIHCKSEGERFLRYAYDYKGDMEDFEIYNTTKDCDLVVDINGKVTCTNDLHTTEECY